MRSVSFFSNGRYTTEIYTLSLHDALPIFLCNARVLVEGFDEPEAEVCINAAPTLSKVMAEQRGGRSEEHTSELQSRFDLVCRLLLEKKKTIFTDTSIHSSLSLFLSPYH